VSDVKNLPLEERLKLLEEKDKLCDRVESGEEVPCPQCGAILKYYNYGIVCPIDAEHFARYDEYNTLLKGNKE